MGNGPIGIKLGGKSAPEIALSIIAQLVSKTQIINEKIFKYSFMV
ncbi:MAG: hypothetical protein CM1200mP5_3950 [Candidatus Pelagibacterales bacterium]|nr:MAG: hypothetical protein CM1200mP5_3950 [Pelagibacterales bacterium]